MTDEEYQTKKVGMGKVKKTKDALKEEIPSK